MEYFGGKKNQNYLLSSAQRKIVDQLCLIMRINHGTPTKVTKELLERYEDYLNEFFGDEDNKKLYDETDFFGFN